MFPKNPLLLILLVLFLLMPASPAFSRTILGISSSGETAIPAQNAGMAVQMEDAFGNLITVHNYHDKTTLLSMLTQFNKLDAALISRQTYEQQEIKKLIILADVHVSGGIEQANLVLAARSDLSELQQNHLVQGYQELLLSTEGLELLERYASASLGANTAVADKPAPPIAMSTAAEEPVAVVGASSTLAPAEVLPVPDGPITAGAKPQAIKPAQAIAATTPATKKPAQPSTEARVRTIKFAGAESVQKRTPKAEEPLVMPAPVVTQSSSSTNKNKKWGPHVDLKGKLGNERSLGDAELFIPLAQNDSSMFFLDLRFQLDDSDNQEGNFGLGYRQMMSDWILGGYAFYDTRESRYNNHFQQWTLGAEALSPDYDARFNLYLADEKEKSIDGTIGINGFTYSSSNLLYSYSYEKALSGFDFEIGGLLPALTFPEIRAYLGGYYFDAPHAVGISGPKARLEVRFNDMFGWERSLFELGGEVRNDRERDTDYYLTARLRIPFGGGFLTKLPAKLTPLEERMTERVVRDPDIITARNESKGTLPLTLNSAAIEITHIDSSGTGGKGTFEAPYGSLTAANEAANSSDIVLLHAGSVFSGEGYQMAADQRLLGDFDGASYLIATDQLGVIALPRASTGSAVPVIQNAPSYAITAGNNSEISNITLQNSATGVFADSLTGSLSLLNINIAGGDNGLFVDNANGIISVDSVTIADAASSNLQVSGGSAEINLLNGSMLSQNSTGSLLTADSGHTGIVSFSKDTLLEAQSGSGLQFDNANGIYRIFAPIVLDGSDTGISITNNSDASISFFDAATINNLTGDAVHIDNSGGTETLTFTAAAPLSITTGAGHGIFASSNGTLNILGAGNSISTSTGTAVKLENTAIGSGGVRFDTITTGTTATSAIDINNVSGGTFYGGDTKVAGTVSESAVTIENSSVAVNFTTIDLDNVAGAGVYLNNSGPLAISGGSIYNTASYGINAINSSLHLDGVSFGGSNGIGDSAIAITADNAAPTNFTISKSLIENIRGKGLQIEASNGAVITSGTVTGTVFKDILYEGIDIWAHDGAMITNVTIGDSAAALAGDVTIDNTGEVGIYLTAGDDGLTSESGTLSVDINGAQISNSNGDSNIVLESLGLGSATYSVSNSQLDGSASFFDNIYLLVDQFSLTDAPTLTALITGNDLANNSSDGVIAGLTADNYSDAGALNLYLAGNAADKGTVEPDYGFLLYNNGAGSMTLYNTAPYTGLNDLLINQNNTGGVFGLIDSIGTIEISPLP